MSKRLFDVDPLTGSREFFHYDEKNDTYAIETEQNVDALVESNKRLHNDAPEHWKGEMHRVASIPMNVYWDLKMRGILDDEKRLRAWLNDPANRYFRTRPGRV